MYKRQGHQIGGLNSEIAYEDLGSFKSEVVVRTCRRRVRFSVNLIFTDRLTGISGIGRNRTCAFYACMAEIARHRYGEWKKAPKVPPMVDMSVIRAA